MEAKAFADLYEPTVPIHTGSELNDLLAPSREWANRFADMAYARLSGETLHQDQVSHHLRDYNAWMSKHLIPLHAQLKESSDQSAALRGLSEINFHRLNFGMLPMWKSLLEGRQSNAEVHRDVSYTARDIIAQQGFRMYKGREVEASIQNDHRYFSEENRDQRQVLDGIINEHDTAVVLLNAIKNKPGVAVVPAPSGFEHGNKGKYNVDFIVADLGGFAVGVQAKLSVKQQDYERYDQDAVVLVCGDADFASTAAKRTTKGRSTTRLVAWPGMICGHIATTTPLHGTFLAGRSQAGSRDAPRKTIVERAQDKKLIGNIKPHLGKATGIVGQRVMAKLYAQPEV